MSRSYDDVNVNKRKIEIVKDFYTGFCRDKPCQQSWKTVLNVL